MSTDPLFMKVGNQYYWYYNGHLGTPQKLTTSSGAVVWKAKYTSFGKATVESSSTVVNPFRFPGQYEDVETELHYNGYRYFDADIGRYLRIDPFRLSNLQLLLQFYLKSYLDDFPILSTDRVKEMLTVDFVYLYQIYNPQQMDSYSCVQNNPMNLIDPFGLDSLTNSMISVYGLHSRPMNHNDPISNSTNAIASHLYHAYADYDFHRASKEASAYLNSDYVQKQFQTLISFAVDTPSGETAIGLNYLELAINLKGNPKALIIRGLIAGGELYLLKKEELKDKTCDE